MADEDHVKLYARVSAQQFLMKRILAQLASENAEEDDPWELLEGLKSEIAASWPKTPEESEFPTEASLEQTLVAVQEILTGAQELVDGAEGSDDPDGEADDDDWDDEYEDEDERQDDAEERNGDDGEPTDKR